MSYEIGEAMKPITILTAAALASLAVAACDRPGTKSTAAPSSSTTVVTTAPAPSTPAQTADSSSPTASTATSSTAATGAGSTNAVTDTLITGKVKAAITADNGMKDADVSVKTENGVVTLTGSVKSPDQVTLAAALAQRQEGVSRVENQVAVK
jgi:hyperosmotically inducible protein